MKSGKEAMVLSRIRKRMRVLQIETPSQYLAFIESEDSGEELIHFLDVITTNYTAFYRESDHFDFMRVVVKDWREEGRDRFRFWSAAAATGEEPYSMAITLSDLFAGSTPDYRILATDLSTLALRAAGQGCYDETRLGPVPRSARLRYFTRETQETSEPLFRIRKDLRQRIVFKRLNLSKPPFPMRGPLDIVFCRNVMIYFDRDIRQALITEIERLLRPGGYLFIGHVETLSGMVSSFVNIHPSIYQKPEA